MFFNGVISNGALTLDSNQAGSAGFEFAGAAANTYTGLTTVQNVVLTLDKSVSNGAIIGDLVVNTDGAIFIGANEQIADTSTVTLNGNGIMILAGFNERIGTLLGDGNILLNDGGGGPGGTLTIGAGNFSGVIHDDGEHGSLTKVGPGTLILSGTNTYNGDTNINGGVLQLDGTIGSATFVNSGGTLAGIGTIIGNGTNSGVVSPGDSGAGTLSIMGGYTQNANGTLRIEIGGIAPGQFDRLGTGSASLNGTLQLLRLNNFTPQPGDTVTILTTGIGDVSGTFSAVTNNFPTIVQPHVVYDLKDVLVVFEQGSFASLTGLSPNQKSVANELDEVAGDSRAMALIDFLNMEPLGNLPHDYDLIAPEELASLYEISISQAVVQNNNLQRRMDDIRAGSNGFCAEGFQVRETQGFSKGTDGKTVIDKNPAPYMQPAPDNRWGVFVTGFGEFVDVGNEDFNARGFEITNAGFTLGVDYRVCDNFAIGLNAGYAHSWADLVDRGRVTVDGGKIGAYATWFSGGFHVDGAISGGFNDYDTVRTGLQDLPVRGSTNGAELNGLFAIGYDFRFGCLNVGPIMTVQYTYINIEGFTETGSLAPLEIQDQAEDSVRGTLGLRAAYDWKAGNGIIVRPEVRAAWQHEYDERAYPIDARFASGAGDVFTVRGPDIGRNSALVGAGVAVQWNNRISTYVYYDGVLGRENYNSHNISGGVRLSF